MTSITFRARFSRRAPEPLANGAHNTQRHVLFVPVTDLPAGIVLARGMRTPKTRWDIYKDVLHSLLDKDCTPGIFHLKNQGITLIAREVHNIDDEQYEVDFAQGQGIVDGSNTYRLILEAQENPDVELPKNQYVKVQILTNVPQAWVGEIADALNTSMLAHRDSLLDLRPALTWIKDELQAEPYFKSISWSEEQRGLYDVRDILSILTCFNTASYANAGSSHPVVAYDNRSVVLRSFEEDYKNHDGAAYRKLRPLLKDALVLHDTIALEFPKVLQRGGMNAPELVERAVKRPYEFPFLQTRSTERLAAGALLPVLAAFRWMVEDDPASGQARWRGGFPNVLERWRAAAERLVMLTVEKSKEVGNSPDAIGRSASHWSALHKDVAFVDLMAQQTAASVPPAPEPPAEPEDPFQETAPAL